MGLALLVFGSLPAFAQPAVSADELVRKTVENEIEATANSKYMFTDHKQTPHGSQTKLMVQTRQATAGMVIANDGHPLNATERQAEYERIDRFVKYPEELGKKEKQEQEDAERVKRIMRALPEAFLFQYDGEETGRPGLGKPGDKLLRLTFRPNPHYSPPSRVEQVLLGMQGVVLVDAEKHRIAKIDGTLRKEVSFGWGILGHLDKGGRFQVNQGDIGENHWEITRMDLDFTGKILLFKHLTIRSTETSSDFRRVSPDLTFAQGVELLKKQEALLAKNNSQSK